MVRDSDRGAFLFQTRIGEAVALDWGLFRKRD